MNRSAAAIAAVCLALHSATGGDQIRLTPRQMLSGATPQATRPLPVVTGWESPEVYLERRTTGTVTAVHRIEAATGRDLGRQEAASFDRFASLAGGVSLSRPLRTQGHFFIYRHESDLFVLDTLRPAFTRLTREPGEEQNPTFSPDGRTLAYTRGGNLFAADVETGTERQLTSDGSETITNGYASWVYMEEILGRPTAYRAFWWSPDAKSIAFMRFDDTRVPEFTLIHPRGQHGTLEKTRYPKAGDRNPAVRVGVVAPSGGGVRWAPFDESADQYFGTPFWTPDGSRLLIQWMNRGQDTLLVYAFEPSRGSITLLLREHQKSWVDWYEAMTFLPDSRGILLVSDADGWSHITLQPWDGGPARQLTRGPWSVVKVEKIVERDTVVLFTAKKEASTRTDLYRVNLDGTGMKRLTFGPYTHSVNGAPDGSSFVTTYSNTATPPRMALIDAQGRVLRELFDSRTDSLDLILLAQPEIVPIPTSDGIRLPARLVLPAEPKPGMRYPVLISTYGGPLSGSVTDGWRLNWTEQAYAAEGAIQLTIDHRGSGHHGKAGAALMHRNLGKWEMHDLVEVVKWLRKRPDVDSTRVCISGSSYGGYVSALALTLAADYVQYGIPGLSVIDWKLYDSHYTERYMDSPAENPDGYRQASVLTHAGRYKGLMRLVHGMMDDNVHVQNTMQLADTLQILNKHFELMLYPGERHGWGPPKSAHSSRETIRFIYTHVLRREFRDEWIAGSSRRGTMP